MKKYISTIIVFAFALNMQTYLFAADTFKKGNSALNFESFLPSSELNISDFKDKLIDNDFIILDKILLPLEEKAYNDLMTFDPSKNKAQAFKENLKKAYTRAQIDAAYAKILPDVLHRIYLSVINNPSSSADFDLTPQEIKIEIAEYSNKIITLFKKDINFIRENKKGSSFAKTFSIILEKDINLLNQYRKAVQNFSYYSKTDFETKINIKQSKAWTNNTWHQEFLIQLAALRYIEANLKYSKSTFKYELARFDIISLYTKSKKNTSINFLDNTFVVSEDFYKFVPLHPGYLADREQKFITALEEIVKKKQNNSYDFITKKNTAPRRGEEPAKTQPSPYESPYGSGSVR